MEDCDGGESSFITGRGLSPDGTGASVSSKGGSAPGDSGTEASDCPTTSGEVSFGMIGNGETDALSDGRGFSFKRGNSAPPPGDGGGDTIAGGGGGADINAGIGSDGEGAITASGSASVVNFGFSRSRGIASGTTGSDDMTGGEGKSAGADTGGVCGGVDAASSARARGRKRKGGGWDSSLIYGFLQ
jgi:hypothetical protein